MRRSTLLLILTVALLHGSPALGQDQIPVELPKDPTTVVITYDTRGGRLKRNNEEPALVIRADGSVTIGNPYGFGKRIETKIPVLEVEELLRFAIREQKFFDFDANKVQAAIAETQKKKGGAIRVGDGSTTFIRIKTAAKEHAAQYYALSTYANHYKDVEALGQLLAVEQRLRRVMYVANAGGPDELAKLLKLANEQLRKEYANAQPLTLEDLQTSGWQGQDKLIVRFFHQGERPELFVTSTVTRPVKGETTVFVKAKLK